MRVRVDGDVDDLGDEIALDEDREARRSTSWSTAAVRETGASSGSPIARDRARLADGLALVDVASDGARGDAVLGEASPARVRHLAARDRAAVVLVQQPARRLPGAASGLGTRDVVDPARVVPDPSRPLATAIEPWDAGRKPSRYYAKLLEALASHFGVSVATPVREAPRSAREGILFGTRRRSRVHVRTRAARRGQRTATLGRRHRLELARRDKDALGRRARRSSRTPRAVPGLRGPAAAARGARVRIGGAARSTRSRDSRSTTPRVPRRWSSPAGKRTIARPRRARDPRPAALPRRRRPRLPDARPRRAARSRAARRSASGSRRRSARALVGVLYVLDEPSIGLHPRDNARLLDDALRACATSATRVIVVEHDDETIRGRRPRASTWAPAPASTAATIVAEGTPAEHRREPGLAHGRLPRRATTRSPIPQQRRKPRASASSCVARRARAQPQATSTLRIPLGLLHRA